MDSPVEVLGLPVGLLDEETERIISFADDGTPVDQYGEVLDASDPDVKAAVAERVKTVGYLFEVCDRASADWALSLRADTEARISSLKVRRDSYVANLNAQIKAEEARLKWWDFRWYEPVIAVARTLLKGKSKTAQFDHAKVSFRETKGTSHIKDEAAAVQFVEAFMPDLVKKSVTVTSLRAAIAEAGDETVEQALIEVTGAGTKVTIDTGIE